MDYQKIYNNLITTRSLKNRVKNNDGCLESHHILPRCLVGTNEKENLVLLTPREHYIAHWLLYRMHTGKIKAKMAYAFFLMCSNNPNQKRLINSRNFECARNAVKNACSGENNHNKGKRIWSDEDRKKIGDRMRGPNNHWYGNKPWNTGLTKETSSIIAENIIKYKKTITENPIVQLPRTEEFKQKISKLMKGVPKSEEHKRKLSEYNKGKDIPQEVRDKISATHKENNKPLIMLICPHCNYEGKGSAMYRWHFDNCKLSPLYDKDKYKISEETRQKMSVASKNKIHILSFKGHKHTSEAKDKISNASKGRTKGPMSDETKMKLSAAIVGRVSSRKGAVCSDETKEKIRKANTGRKQTKEEIQKRTLSLTQKVPASIVAKVLLMYTSNVKPVIKYIARDVGLTVWITNRILKEQGLV